VNKGFFFSRASLAISIASWLLYLFVVATDMPSAGRVHSFENVIVSCTHALVELRSLQDEARNAEKEKGKVELIVGATQLG
jgi:cytochrome oxidase Cu insertion factor (SCO1/SenC/PrrC family)